VAVITLQMDKAITGLGRKYDVITIDQSPATDALIANGEAHLYLGPTVDAPYVQTVTYVKTVNGLKPDGSGNVTVAGGTGTIGTVTISGTPATGQVPTAVSGTAATWQAPTGGSGVTVGTTAGTVAAGNDVRITSAPDARVVALGNITGAVNLDLSLGTVFTGTLTGDVTATFTNPPASGKLCEPLIRFTQDGVGSHLLTVAGVLWVYPGGAVGATAPAVPATPSSQITIPFLSSNGFATVYGFAPYSFIGMPTVAGSAGQVLTLASDGTVTWATPTGGGGAAPSGFW